MNFETFRPSALDLADELLRELREELLLAANRTEYEETVRRARNTEEALRVAAGVAADASQRLDAVIELVRVKWATGLPSLMPHDIAEDFEPDALEVVDWMLDGALCRLIHAADLQARYAAIRHLCNVLHVLNYAVREDHGGSAMLVVAEKLRTAAAESDLLAGYQQLLVQLAESMVRHVAETMQGRAEGA